MTSVSTYKGNINGDLTGMMMKEEKVGRCLKKQKHFYNFAAWLV